jgi:AcrR family transcriptional regulator
MDSRTQKKLKTRSALMNAALELVEQGRHISTISIREVAKGASVVPTAFYRHFTDMDDLGLSLVDELSLMLRHLLRKSRQTITDPQQWITVSIDLYINYVYENRPFFIFMSQSLTGGSGAMRAAVRSELQFFANELALDLRRLGVLTNLSTQLLGQVCELAIQTVSMSSTELVEYRSAQAAPVADIRNRLLFQLRLVFLGAASWREGAALAATLP